MDVIDGLTLLLEGGGLNQDAAQKKRSKSYFYVEFGAETSWLFLNIYLEEVFIIFWTIGGSGAAPGAPWKF